MFKVTSCIVLVGGLIAAPLVGRAQRSEGRTGTSQQALSQAELASEGTQRQLGLVTLFAKSAAANNGSACSGTLLTNDWVLTAAHCVSEGGSETGAIVSPADRLRIGARFGKPDWQDVEAIGIIKYPPFDIAIVQLAHPLDVNGSRVGFSNLYRLDTRGVFRTGETVTLYGAGLSSYATIDEWNKLTTAGDDGLFRRGNAHIVGLKSGTYVLSDAAHVMGGDSGGPTYRMDGTILGVHSKCRRWCADGSRTCGWDTASASNQCTDVSVNPVQQKIKDDISRRMMSDAPYAGVKRLANSVMYINPVIRSEYGTLTRLDKCRQFAKECNEEAADAFCAKQDASLSVASSHSTWERVELTAVIADGRVCRGACDGYKQITCGKPAKKIPSLVLK